MEEESKDFFDELENEEFNQTTEEQPPQSLGDDDDEIEMKPDAFSSYLKTPEVGKSVEFTISNIGRKKGRQQKNSNTGDLFWTGLKKKNETDSERIETIIHTDNNEKFSISSWGLYIGLFGKDSPVQQLALKNGTYAGIKLRITHVYNGKDATTNTEDLMKLRDFETMEQAEEHKKKVGKAMKDGGLYKIEILE